jgi:hypothetical protein
MSAYDFFASKKRVNVLKKVKVQGTWKLCPAVVEANGKLRDRVKVNGHIESHPEGVYYLEWRENGKGVRESVRDKADVLSRARLKALDARVGCHERPRLRLGSFIRLLHRGPYRENFVESDTSRPCSPGHFQAFQSYIQQAVHRALASQTPGLALQASADPELHRSQPGPEQSNCDPAEIPRHQAGDRNHVAGQPESKKTPITQAVESYLRDLEPPQRATGRTMTTYVNELRLGAASELLNEYGQVCSGDCIQRRLQ